MKVFLAATSKDSRIREEEEGGAKRHAGTLLFLLPVPADGTEVGPDGICGELTEPRTKQVQQRPANGTQRAENLWFGLLAEDTRLLIEAEDVSETWRPRPGFLLRDQTSMSEPRTRT